MRLFLSRWPVIWEAVCEVYNEAEVVFWFFLLIILVAAFFAIKLWIKHSTWDSGIDKKAQIRLQVHCPLDSSKGILFISRRVVGFWVSEKTIYKLENQADNLAILRVLARNFNLILYIPKSDQFGVLVDDLAQSANFIIENDFPICYITQYLPRRSKTEPFSCNDDKYWFIKYKKGVENVKWEGYT